MTNRDLLLAAVQRLEVAIDVMPAEQSYYRAVMQIVQSWLSAESTYPQMKQDLPYYNPPSLRMARLIMGEAE